MLVWQGGAVTALATLHLDVGPEVVTEELQSKVKKLPIPELFLDAQKAREELLEPAAGKS